MECLAIVGEEMLSHGKSLILEANFRSDLFSPVVYDWMSRFPVYVLQVCLKTDGNVLLERFTLRETEDRHPGHQGLRFLAELQNALLLGEEPPLSAYDEMLTFDTTDFSLTDYSPLWSRLATLLNPVIPVVSSRDHKSSTFSSFQIRSYHPADEADVITLWKRCNLVVPWNDPQRDIALKRAWQPELLLVGTLDERIVATVMIGYDGHRGIINYLAVSPEHQRSGFGRRLMEEAETRLRALGCPKINLQVRTSNIAVTSFYERLGYKMDDVVNLGKRL